MNDKTNLVKYLAVIPARGGSKRIPRKNLVDLNGKPLIAYTIEAAVNSSRITRTVVSTEDKEIASYSLKYGVEVPFVRPLELAQDDSSILEVLDHAFKTLDSKANPIKAIILLQPTSPFRNSKNIDEAITLFEKTRADTVTAVCYPGESPFYAWKIVRGKLVSLFPLNNQSTPRSKLPVTVMENGAIYIVRRSVVAKGRLYGKKVVPYIMGRESSVDIDEPIDLLWARFLMRQKKEMRPIGGEIEYNKNLHSYFVDSGRSAIRLILQSGFKNKKWLLPDYLCQVIPRILDESKTKYEYYHINEDLTIDHKTITSKKFDVLCVIDYFGQDQKIDDFALNKKITVVEDCVFLPFVKPSVKANNWIGFNSLRKISSLADGSQIRSTFPLLIKRIKNKEATFPQIKYEAKTLKWKYLKEGGFSENKYLGLFNLGEETINKQTGIFRISDSSLSLLPDYYDNVQREYEIRRKNFGVLNKALGPLCIQISTAYPSHCVLAVKNRDKLRVYLFTKRIYLPVHWPKFSGVHNTLYDNAISIPIDSRYSEKEMTDIAGNILKFYELHG